MKDRRRLLLAAGALLLPLRSAAQAGKTARVGFLATEGLRPRLEMLKLGLRDHGYIEGRNLVIEARFAPLGKLEQLDVLAAELVRIPVDVIVAATNDDIAAAKRATSSVPIVMVTAGEPLAQGFVRSLARPGGNVTGLAWSFGPELMGKYVELYIEILPRLQRLGGLMDPGFPITVPFWEATQQFAAAQGVKTFAYEARSPAEFPAAFAAMKRDGVDGVLVFAGPMLFSAMREVAALGLKHRIPLMFGAHGEAIAHGGLVSYGPDAGALYRRSALYVDKILKGAKPGELPVEQPAIQNLRINLKTAKALGIEIPKALLFRADEVIQ
jgi:putative tryptophan/tyrosine transport system substrate-binding protein